MRISEAPTGTSFVGYDGAIYVVTGFDKQRGYMCMRVTQCWYVDDIILQQMPLSDPQVPRHPDELVIGT